MPEIRYTVRELTAENFLRAMCEILATNRPKYMASYDDKDELVGVMVRDMAKPLPASWDMTAIIPLSRSRLDNA